MTKSVSGRYANHGLSLVELLVALAIGLFLSSIITAIYLSSKDSLNYQEAMSRLQENARFAMDRMSKDIRMAGYNTCGSLGSVANTINGSPSSWWLNLSTPIIGYDNLSAGAQFPGSIAETDAIILLGVNSEDELSVISHNANAATIATTTHSYKPGTILVISDCSQTSVFQMSGPTNNNGNASQVNHDTGNSISPGNCNKELGASCPSAKAYTFKAGASVMQMYANAYYIRTSDAANNGNALWQCSITGQTNGATQCNELINGVENMQIEYGIDTDNDRSANAYLPAGSVTDWTQAVSVRITLLMATPPSAGNLSSKPQTYTYNNAIFTATDRRVRQTFSSTISLRNRSQ